MTKSFTLTAEQHSLLCSTIKDMIDVHQEVLNKATDQETIRDRTLMILNQFDLLEVFEPSQQDPEDLKLNGPI